MEQYTVEDIVRLAQQEIAYYKLPLTASERDGNLLIATQSTDVELAQKSAQSLYAKLGHYIAFNIRQLEFGDHLPLVEPGPVEGKLTKAPYLRLVK